MDRKESPVESGYNSCAGINNYVYILSLINVYKVAVSENADTGRSDGLCAGERLKSERTIHN